MKKTVFLSLCAFILVQPIQACDICGCSIGNGFSTILPQFNKNFIGIRGSYAQFNSHHIDNFENINHEKSSSLELWGRFYLHKRVQLLTALPYNIKSQEENDVTTEVKGIGDASVSINYTLLNVNRDTAIWKHLLQIGAGIKLPTGKYNAENGSSLSNIYLQPGTGSFDYLFNLLYTIRHRKIGWSNDMQYKYSSENPEKYEFGNRYSLNSRLFYWKSLGKSCNVLPSVGVLTERYDKDYKNGYVQHETGGTLNSITLGCELYYRQFLVSFNYNQPFRQNLSNGNVKSLSKTQLNICFLF